MNRACLLIALPALLIGLGFAQTPTTTSNSDATSIKGCLGGSDGNYTLVEDNTGHNFKITTSTVDLKPHLGHDISLVGQKPTATASSGTADNTFAVTAVNMISEHCTAAAAAPAASISAPADNAIPPPAAAAVPAATIPTPPDTAGAPAADAETAAATVTTAPDPAIIPSAPAAPVVTGPTPAEVASVPAATPPTEIVEAPPAAAGRTQPAARSRRASASGAAAPLAAAPPHETATPVADAATLPATDSTPSATATEPAPLTSALAVPAKRGSSLWIPIVVVVLIMGALIPLLNRWRRRRLLAQSGDQNLSFSHRASSEPGISNKPVPRKAA
jgi:hypothetical protein